jgi:hypothetical protein
MTDRILKGEQSKQGDNIVVSARELRSRQPGPSESPALPRTQPRAAGDGGTLKPAPEHRLSEAERIVADAEQMAQEIAQQAEVEACRKREELESEIEQLLDSTTREMETQRAGLEREQWQRIEAEYRARYFRPPRLDQAAADCARPP